MKNISIVKAIQRIAGFVVVTAIGFIAMSLIACPLPDENNQTPKAADYTISGIGTFTYDGSVKIVTVTAKTDKSTGAVTVKYNNNTTAPSAIGTYTVTFDVAAASGWNEARDLSAGTLAITGTPVSPTGIEMVYVPGGSFEMGDVKNEGADREKPVHTVTLSGFYMGKYEVTQAQYLAVMGTNPSYFTGNPADGEIRGNRPVEQVSWYDAIEFCNALSTKEGLSPYYTIDKINKDPNNQNLDNFDYLKWTVTRNNTANGYRLPTEAQWEYAAKGGNGSPGNYTYAGSNTVDDVAWYLNNSGYIIHEVGKKVPNGLGLYDMSGNVWEYCWDWYGSYSSEVQTDPTGAAIGHLRVMRGGGWGMDVSGMRSAFRVYCSPYDGGSSYGFRLVRSSDAVSSITVTFDSNGGSSVNPQTLNSGATATRPTNPTKSGYTFDNWYSDSGLTTVYNFSTPVTGNITLYAKWNPVVVSPTGIEMVYVPGGSFEMGNDIWGTGYPADVWPVHTVTLSGFYMGRTEVTQEQYQSVMGSNPSNSYGVGNNFPVYNVSWYDAIEFCNALSIQEGLNSYYTIDKTNKDPNNTNTYDSYKWTITRNSTANGYRLPTEAQWEYAAKGGNGTPGNYTYSGSNTIGDVAWYEDNSDSKAHEVGKKQPNGLGIYDMSGNVYEWCWDWHGAYASEAQTDPQGAVAGDFRVNRGGSWNEDTSSARSAVRSNYWPITGYFDLGFRLVRPSDAFSGFTSIAEFAAWLSSQPANTAATAYRVALNVNSLDGDADTSGSLGYVLKANSSKYVSLDLSGSTITTIAEYAFYSTESNYTGCANLTGIIIPNSVTSIGDYAFCDCTGLASVNIPNNVTNIGEAAFLLCSSLTSVTIPNSVTSIGNGAFADCNSLLGINVDSNNANYTSDLGVLYDKNKTTLIQCPGGKTGTFTIPNSVTSIERSAFYWCTNLTSITIPNSVISIRDWAFSGCSGLTSITIPDSVTSIWGYSFSNCTSLTSVTFQGTIDNLSTVFPGDLHAKYLAGGIGTYTTANPGDYAVWTKQP